MLATMDASNEPFNPLAASLDLLGDRWTLLIVNALQLETAPGEIAPDGRMFGEGMGLDSIDALELALAITRAYGFELRSDDERNHQIFASLRSLTRHIEQHRTR